MITAAIRYFLVLIIFFVLSIPGIYANQAQYDFTVSQNGSGNFKTVQEAINAVPDFRKKVTTIYIKKGVYKEKLVLAGSKQLVRLIFPLHISALQNPDVTVWLIPGKYFLNLNVDSWNFVFNDIPDY
ncbi:MAG: hypothetical protein H7Y13_12410 [Sphingobacteriaceae bacterium]|nr:hypothetical protein [Sphingobacteriaceae bacterium]